MRSKITSESITEFFSYGVHFPSKTIYLGDWNDEGEVSPATADRIIKGLHLLDLDNRRGPIRLLINTRGGCSYNGFAIFSAIRACRTEVVGEVCGAAWSVGAVILQATDRRLMHARSTLMIHDGELGINSQARDAERWAEHSKRQRQETYALFAKRTGRTPAYWAGQFQRDNIYSADEALAAKLIDAIIEDPGP